MKTTVTRKVSEEIEVKRVEILIPISEIGDHDPEIPEALRRRLTVGDHWRLLVDIDTGRIENWPEDAGALDLYCKPRDGGTYRLLGADDQAIAAIEQGYVPHGLIPGEYGDYVDLKIDAAGIITNWPKAPDVSAFFQDGAES